MAPTFAGGSGHAAGAGSPSRTAPLPVPLLTTEKEPAVDVVDLCDFFEDEALEVVLSIEKDLSEEASLFLVGILLSVGVQ